MRVIVLLSLLVFYHGAQAQRPFSRDFWLNETSTPVKVNAFAEDRSGYIWVGADNGLYRFNGRDFTFFKDSIHQPVTAVACSRDEVFIGYANGMVARQLNGVITPVAINNRKPQSVINNIYADASGMLWLCTEEGIFGVLNSYSFLLDKNNGLSDNFTYSAAFFSSGQLYAGTDNGINKVRLDARKMAVERYSTQHGLPDNIVRVLKPVKNSPSIWIGTHEGGLARVQLRKNALDVLKYADVWQWGQVNDILPVSESEAWASTEDGYVLHVTGKEKLEITPYLFEGKKIKRLLLIRSGNLWLATNEGLTIFTIAHAGYHILKEPFAFSALTTMACDSQRTIWLAQGRELLRISSAADTAVPQKVTELPAAINCIYAGNNELWLGTFGKGLWRFKNGALDEITNIGTLKDGNILTVTQYRGNLWVASLNGVDELGVSDAGVRLVKHHDKKGIGSDYVYQLHNDNKGNLWMATDGAGISMFNGMSYNNWDSSIGITSKVAYSITSDRKGNIWAGTLQNGLFRYNGKSWNRLSAENGLQDVNIYSVIANATGQVVVVTKEGIDEWYPESNLFRHFNKNTNLNIDSISPVYNCVARDIDGNVYVPFDKGLIVFKNVTFPVDLKPAIALNDVSVFFKSVKGREPVFGHDENQVTFTFEGINFSNTERLYYRYKLEGYNNDWVGTTDETVTFSQLSPGEFTFRIQASLDRDFEEAREASYHFVVKQPFWEKLWFYLLAAFLVFGGLYAYIKWRERELKKVNRLQSERMRFEYEHLKSQVNPHFLFNSLNTLSSLIEEDSEKAVNYTSQLADLYRSMLSYKDMDLISLSDELEIMYHYMYIQQTRFGNALKLEVDIPAHLRRTKKIIPLAMQILVENAIKHNVVSRNSPLVITVVANEDEIVVKNHLSPKMSKEKGEGLGLLNIRSRYALLTKKHISCSIANNEYIVSLPLL